jgi:hypothetical protein
MKEQNPMNFEEVRRDYAVKGWQAFPLPAGKKSPPPSGLTGESGRTPTAKEVGEWKTHDGNVGIRAPDGVVGLDIDAYKTEGVGTFSAAESRWGKLPAAPYSTSRDDGSRIAWFSVPRGLKWPGVLGPGVEIIQANHRYAVVSPSIHPEGRPYRWFSARGERSLVPPLGHLPTLPKAWVDGLTAGVIAVPTARGDGHAMIASIVSQTPAGACVAVPAALVKGLGSMHGAGRHDAARDHSLALLRLGEQGHAGALEALEDLGRAFVHGITDRGTIGAAEAEWARILKGGADRVAGQPTNDINKGCCGGMIENKGYDDMAGLLATPPANDATVTAQPVAKTPREQAISVRANAISIESAARAEAGTVGALERLEARDLPQIMSLPDMIGATGKTPDWRYAGLAECGDRILIEAAAKTGKSTLIGNMVASLLGAGDLLDHFATKPLDASERVLLIDTELGAAKQARWLSESTIPEHERHRALVWSIAGKTGSLDIRNDAVRAQLTDMIQQQGKLGALIVDVAGAWLAPLGIDENSNTEVRSFLENLHSLAQDVTTTGNLVLAHHTGLAGNRARGASAWRDWPDVFFTLQQQAHGQRTFKAFGRDVNFEESVLGFNEEERKLSITDEPIMRNDASVSARGREDDTWKRNEGLSW